MTCAFAPPPTYAAPRRSRPSWDYKPLVSGSGSGSGVGRFWDTSLFQKNSRSCIYNLDVPRNLQYGLLFWCSMVTLFHSIFIGLSLMDSFIRSRRYYFMMFDPPKSLSLCERVSRPSDASSPLSQTRKAPGTPFYDKVRREEPNLHHGQQIREQ